jgi:hypothetical protein
MDSSSTSGLQSTMSVCAIAEVTWLNPMEIAMENIATIRISAFFVEKLLVLVID